MKPFFYTLVLTAVLIASVMFLRSLDAPPVVSIDDDVPAPRSSPMAVNSEPAPRSSIDVDELEATNNAALYQTGLELLDLWHVPEAIDVFETLVEKDSTHVEAYLRLVESYANRTIALDERAAECLDLAGRAMKATGRDTLLLHGYRLLFVERAPDQAVVVFGRELERDRDGVDVRYLVATALLESGQTQEAIRQVTDLLDGDESLGRARELLVRCHVAAGDIEEADRQARRLAAMYPEEPYPYVLLSRVQVMRGRVQEGVEFCNNALVLDNRYIPAIVARADLFVLEGKMEAARVAYEKLMLFDDAMLSAIGTEGLAYVDFLTGHFEAAADAMDEAIRHAMSIGSARVGLVYAFRLVDYLCELGRVDAAAAVVDRWITRHGRIPEQLGRLRIHIAEGDVATARHALERIGENPEWLRWMGALSLERADLRALTHIREEEFSAALDVLDDAGTGANARRAYLRGFALFRSGRAEDAEGFFEASRYHSHDVTFPYHRDPILYVQSVFFLAESALARGESDEARKRYEEFLSLWGDADWELQAVARAADKLKRLLPDPGSTNG